MQQSFTRFPCTASFMKAHTTPSHQIYSVGRGGRAESNPNTCGSCRLALSLPGEARFPPFHDISRHRFSPLTVLFGRATTVLRARSTFTAPAAGPGRFFSLIDDQRG